MLSTYAWFFWRFPAFFVHKSNPTLSKIIIFFLSGKKKTVSFGPLSLFDRQLIIQHLSKFVRHFVMQLVYQFCYNKYKVLLYLWLIKPALKHCKVLKCFSKDCLKILILFSTLSMIIQVSEESTFLAKKFSFIKKLIIIKIESFLKWNFDLNQTCKLLLTQNQ